MGIDIVMATYNGARFLREQLDSIVAQDHKDWRLLIRDDGSTDGTTKIIHEYAAKHPRSIVFFDNQGKNLGVGQNFGELLASSRAPYVMFADQDDVWMKNKISLTLGKMQEMERQHGDKPLLVYTDSKVCNARLNVTHPSVHEFHHYPKRAQTFKEILSGAHVQGCTIMANRTLVDAALPLHDNNRNHDGWMALVAGATGEIGFLTEPTLYYRRHDVAISDFGKPAVVLAKSQSWEQKVSRVCVKLDNSLVVAKALRQQVGDRMPPDRREVLDKFICLEHEPRYIKGIKLIAQGYVQPTLKSTLGTVFWR